MRNLLKNLTCFFLILILIKSVFVFFFGDEFIYEEAGAKGDRYEVTLRKSEFAKEEFDTVFIGSSRTVFGVSPAYFDYLTGGKTHSYNFGVISGLPPRTFDWCEEVIQTKPSLKYVFFELSARFAEAEDKNIEPTADYFNNLFLNFFRPSIPKREVLQNQIEFNIPSQNIPLREFLSKKDKPLPKNFSLEKVRLSLSYNEQVENENFQKNVSFDDYYWKRITELIKLAESKNVRIYFFIPPRLKTENELKRIYPLYKKLPEKHKLKVSHNDEILYQTDTSFDTFHLNYKGAKKFTELIAEAFKNKEKSK